MTNNYTLQRSIKPGDMAVNGLLAGIVAGSVMLAWLIMSGLLVGSSVTATLALFNRDPAASPLVGGLLHLSVATIYGLLFGVLAHGLLRLPRLAGVPLWAVGMLYSVLLLALAQGVLLPSADSALLRIPLLQWVIAHLVYGVTLGVAFARSQSQ